MSVSKKWAAIVSISQSGGKYGALICPVCGERAQWKFTQSTGWCESCHSSFFYTGGQIRAEGDTKESSSHVIDVEVEKALFGLTGMAGNLMWGGGHIKVKDCGRDVEIHFSEEHGRLVADNERLKGRVEEAVKSHLGVEVLRFTWFIGVPRSVQ